MSDHILLLDAGNTRLKWAVANSEFDVLNSGVADYASMNALFAGSVLKGQIERVAVSCVAGKGVAQRIQEACSVCGMPDPLFAKVTAAACGLSNDYKTLDQLGVDRWVAALGAFKVFSAGEKIIVDAGTAVTVDWVDSRNVFQGGVILPGTKLMHDSLVGKTAGIKSQSGEVLSVLGKNTQECVNAGAFYGLAGAVERVVAELVSMRGRQSPWQVLVCGGDAQKLAGQLTLPEGVSMVLQPDLIFIGLLNLLQTGELV